MTVVGESGFLIRPEAFKSKAELQKTVLHELYRLNTSNSANENFRSLSFSRDESSL